MAGVDTVRGIAFQQAQAVLMAIATLDDADAAALRVEGTADIVDVEVLTLAGAILRAAQIKVRADDYTWGKSELLAVLRRWADLPVAGGADFEFVTDGRLGPTGELVQSALASARDGAPEDLAELLSVPIDSPACHRLARARVRRDPVKVGALLLRAERQVAAMLPMARTSSDLQVEAAAAVDRLFRLLLERGGTVDPDARVVARSEIADVLGVHAEQAAQQRWPGVVRDRYIAAASELPLHAVTMPLLAPGLASRPVVRSIDAAASDAAGVSVMLNCGPAAILSGRTGTGKTTACSVLIREAGAVGGVALVAHAEGYLPGRLDALAADAVSAILGDPMPAATGRQALADPAVTLVIDGASEVSGAIRDALAEDLRAPIAAGHGASVVLVGRDLAALRAAIPTSVEPVVFAMVALDDERRYDLANRLLLEEPGAGAPRDGAAPARALVARVVDALGDAAGNPLLFSMAATLVAAGASFENRAKMYETFVERLAARTGATDIVAAARVLGVAYAGLLDDARRSADPYEWAGLIASAVEAVHSSMIDARRVDAVARRSGIVTTVGYAQTVVPMHDSFADYLAGAAQASGLVEFPERLREADEQRLTFGAEIAGVEADLAVRVARDLPFLAIRLAAHDQRQPDEDTPEEVARVLRHLLPADTESNVALWRRDGRVVAFLDGIETSRWVDDDMVGQRLVERAPAIVSNGGPLDIAVRVWRQVLRRRLSFPSELAPPRAASIEDACAFLTDHATATSSALSRLLGEIAPASAAPTVAAYVGPFGLTARVHNLEAGVRGGEWPVTYMHSREVDVQPWPADVDFTQSANSGRASVESLLAKGPRRVAADRLKAAFDRLAGEHWL